MSYLRRRNNTILTSISSSPEWAASFTVIAYAPGGVVTAVSTGQTITLDAGHGFANGDDIQVGITGTMRTIDQAPTATTIHVSANVTVATGDIIINLGNDSGSGSSPGYDGSTVTIYSDEDGGSAINNSQVTCDAQGGYGYWHNADIWELVRNSSGSAVAVIRGVTGGPLWPTSSGLTAATGQTQLGLLLTAIINEVSTCANAGDSVVLPPAAAGAYCVVINNGAQACQIFPASGDDLGNGLNGSTSGLSSGNLAAGSMMVFHAYDTTTWSAFRQVIET
jgi:hypothetical protein